MKLKNTTQQRRRYEAGLTLIEIMVVVIILGVLAATIIPQFRGTTSEAKVSTARSNIAEIESALERFYVHMDRYPTTEEGLEVIVTAPGEDAKTWRGPYVKKLRDDPWGTPFRYVSPAVKGTGGFDLWSLGADKAEGGEGDDADVGNWD
jgi:general secretion pathway protein G